MGEPLLPDPPRSWWSRVKQSLFGIEPAPLSIHQMFAWYLGPNYDRNVETHEKSFPGYDLPSLHRAVESFFEESCLDHREVGACQGITMRILFDLLKQPWYANARPMAATYHRTPVDVAAEHSFPTNTLSLAVMETDAKPERIAVLIAMSSSEPEYYDNIDGRHAIPQQQVMLSVACRDRDVADNFFAEIEERRKRLSIYRGKVIDPVLTPGGVRSIGFRPIPRVTEENLLLPEKVKELIHSSIIRFYRHRDKLEALGIEMKRGILFHSPPGTGKTSISLYLAGLLPNFTICFVSGERLLYPREVCRLARYLQPSMVVFEDIDLVAEERNATGLATVLGELMNQIDGCEVTDQVLFIMNTNSLERLEHAVRNRPGRVDQIIAVPLPDEDHREQLIRHFGKPVELQISDMQPLLDATDGATPAMLKEIVKRAAVAALDHATDEKETLTVTEADLLLATEQVRALRDPERDVTQTRFGFREG